MRQFLVFGGKILSCCRNLVYTCHSVPNLFIKFPVRTLSNFEPKLKIMKVDTPEFHSLFTPELKKLIQLFEKHGHELRIAGGAVRDLLRGQSPNDIDFATTATPDDMKLMFENEGVRMINMKGEQHGTVTCRINEKENFEVTTLRIDVKTDGRHAEVEFTKNWELDSLRRDLTINSMFLGFDGSLYDYFCGKEDLEQKNVKFVGDARARIQEDYLRILRYFRFYGRIGAEPDDHEGDTLQAIKENMHGLAGISGERIWVELKKILTGNYAGPLIRTMMELGMAPYIGLRNDPRVREFERVWDRCHDLKPLPLTLMPALMDTEFDVNKLNERLKMSRDEVRLGLFIVQYRKSYPFDADSYRHSQDLLYETGPKDPKCKDRICELLKYLDLRETLTQFSSFVPKTFPVTGYQLLERGVEKGPKFAKTLKALKERWKESAYTLTDEELLKYVDELKNSIK